ncbi:MAG: flagellar biosynthesis protein FlhF [Bdellovibrionaceae bacterium]|nr:flagellar biosynthesis protein FlhF [Pseudobdellovibrionaceae bacterium]NUM59722.1 flagellar biosynthesis protein FlhF [Pseudobdellovibrionaceae bacterium]
MQVKKFEARSMKEALELVKTQLGPDAIILSAKDNSKKYGLVGDSSFEITAAVSDDTLHKKKFVESKMADQDKSRFNSSSARVQKEIINKFVQKHVGPSSPKPITTQRYIDIDEERSLAEERIKNAAQRAFEAFDFKESTFNQSPGNSKNKVNLNSKVVDKNKIFNSSKDENSSGEIESLKNEILSLKQMISQMNQKPLETSVLSSYPGSSYGIHYELSQHFQNLVKEGINEDQVAEMILEIQEQIPAIKLKNKALVEGILAKKILDSIFLSDMVNKKFHFFVGPSGNGKTSSLIKMASQLIVREGKRVAILSADIHKVGAVEQLKIYSQILNVPFAVIRDKSDWKEILKFINNIDYILVDFPGLSMKSSQDHHFFEKLVVNEIPHKAIHLVLSSRNKFEDMQETLQNYFSLKIDDVIFNHIDESIHNGAIFSFIKSNQIPIHSFGIGPRIPEDFEPATKERLVDLIFHITKKNNSNQEVQV